MFITLISKEIEGDVNLKGQFEIFEVGLNEVL